MANGGSGAMGFLDQFAFCHPAMTHEIPCQVCIRFCEPLGQAVVHDMGEHHGQRPSKWFSGVFCRGDDSRSTNSFFKHRLQDQHIAQDAGCFKDCKLSLIGRTGNPVAFV